MRTLYKEHIVDVFVWVDDSLPKQLPNSRGGRLTKLRISGTTSIFPLIPNSWKLVTERFRH